MTAPAQLLIFDFDGTLADSEAALIAAYGRMRTEYDLPELSDEDFHDVRHKAMAERIAMLRAHGVKTYMIPGIILRLLEEMRKDIDAISLFPDIPEIMRELRTRGYRLVILSSNKKETICDILVRYDLDIFETIMSGTSFFGKARKLNKVLRHQEVLPMNAVYIGDEVRDIEAAQKAGMRSVACTWGLESENNLSLSLPKNMVHTPNELLDLFSEID